MSLRFNPFTGALEWVPSNAGKLPIGGTAGQVLAKVDASDYNTEWVNQATSTTNLDGGNALSVGSALPAIDGGNA
jgi:hypothetical protein